MSNLSVMFMVMGIIIFMTIALATWVLHLGKPEEY